MIKRIVYTFVSVAFVISALTAFNWGEHSDDSRNLPSVGREFRAAWIATVANINWPSQPGLSTDEQKKEAIYLLNLLEQNNFNAAIFQVRPQADALYESKLEPWSYYLTGEQGKAPDPYYDPLEFWINEAHNRGIEMHVWLNPYRAHHLKGGKVSSYSVVKKYPELVVELSSGYWWFDPSKQETRNHSKAVVMDIVKRYDIDGVHFDDYFYPYPSYHKSDFPDDESWKEYIESGGDLSRGDWRRESINIFIEELYEEIKDEKPYVKFGISPFGIWRPNYPKSIQGFDQFNKLYADAKLWLNEGWIDYWTPQLYWTINKIPQSYPVLLGWWKKENSDERHIWPGISVGRGRDKSGVDENINQIMITRGMLPGSPGNVHWNISGIINKEFADALLEGPYKEQALVPSSPWLDDDAPEEPVVNAQFNKEYVDISWTHEYDDEVYRNIVYYKRGDGWNYEILNESDNSFSLPVYEINYSYMKGKTREDITDSNELLNPLTQIAVSAVDRIGNESSPVVVDVSEIPNELTTTIDEIFTAYESRQEDNLPIYYLIRCDDMGMCHALNSAINKVIDTGIPMSTSVMFACPWYQEAVDILKEHPEVGVGIHLTLNAEWENYRWGPVLGKEAVPSLVDSIGYFFPSRSKLFANNPKKKEIEMELRAQIERALNSGIRIDYIDYHMGAAVQTKELRELVENLAEEYGLGMSGYFNEVYSNITYNAPLGTKKDSLLNYVRNLKPGINMQVFHVGFDNDEMRALKDLNSFGLKEMSRHREEELLCLLSEDLREILNEENIIPITYKDLIEKIGIENMYRPDDSEY